MSGKTRKALSVVLAALLALAAMAALATAAPGGPGGEEEEEIGNNLSYPLIWGEGAGIVLPEVTTPSWSGATDVADIDGDGTAEPDEIVWLQQSEGNLWQADIFDASAVAPVNLDYVDWGDNLEAKPWKTNAQIRVETVLFKDTGVAPFVSMDGYRMYKVGATTGMDEMWGTNKELYDPMVDELPGAIVYSKCARLTIQRLQVDREDPLADALEWYAPDGKWIGDEITEPQVNMTVQTTEDGPGGYGAELNIQGKVVYGYNWNTDGYWGGDYRITYSLDDDNCAEALNTFITDETEIKVSEEETTETLVARAEPDMGGGLTYIDGEDNLTYIDVRLTGPVAPDEPGSVPSDYVPPEDDGDETPTTPAEPPAGEAALPPAGAPAPVQEAGSQTAPCLVRTKFTLRLANRLRIATKQRMRIVRRAIVTVDGKRVKARFGKKGITVPIDLTAAKRSKARVRVELRLRKAIKVVRNGKVVKTKRIVRVYSFPTCAAG